MIASRFRPFIIVPLLLISWNLSDSEWLVQKRDKYNLNYTSQDKKNIREYSEIVDNGIASVNTFFNASYSQRFDIYIHPDRHSLDSAWQKDWKMPEFKSECWMVASGVAHKLDMISPVIWSKAACEHSYSDKTKTQQLIAHELVHVFHGQWNKSPDFSDTENIDWFVEGLATYASGQCDSIRITEVKKAITDQKIPTSLDNFWSGKLRYGLSGSVVMYIDHQYGRIKLKELLSFNKKTDILKSLNITEAELFNGWQDYMMKS